MALSDHRHSPKLFYICRAYLQFRNESDTKATVVENTGKIAYLYPTLEY